MADEVVIEEDSDLSSSENQCLEILELVTSGRGTDAWKLMDSMGTDTHNGLRREFQILFDAFKAVSLIGKGHYQAALRHIFLVLGELERSRFRHRLAWVYSGVGFALGVLGDPERGMEWSQRALAKNEFEIKSASKFTLLCNHGSLLSMVEQFKESIFYLHEAVALRQQDNPDEKYVGLNNIAYAYLEWARQTSNASDRSVYAQEAVKYAREAMASASTTGIFKNDLSAHVTYCNALLCLEQFDIADEALGEALAIGAKNTSVVVELMLGMAVTAQHRADFTGAADWLGKAEAVALDNNLERSMYKLFEARMLLEERANRPVEALACAKRYIEFQKTNYKGRMQAMARSAVVFADAEQHRWEASEMRLQTKVMGEQIAALDRQRSLGQMSATLAHEINQPLTAIQMSAQALQRSLTVNGFDRDKQVKIAERIVFNVRRAADIVLKIRNFIKPATMAKSAIDMNRVVLDVVELLGHDALAKEVRIDLQLADTPVRVFGDALQLSQVLVNLLRNAFEATDSANERIVWVKTDVELADLVVIVRDNGPGFPLDTLPVALPFFTSKANGLGIGLSISRDILNLHGGTLTISNEPKSGARMEIRLPRITSVEAPRADS